MVEDGSAQPRVLLIEHEMNLGRLFRAALEDEGFRIELVLAPDDPVAEARQRRPDLLVIDLLPPTEPALRLLDALRTDDVTRAVPVVVLTTVDAIYREGAASYNVSAVLQKPFELDDFVDAVREHSSVPSLLARVSVPRPEGGDFRAFAEHVLAMRSRQIVFRWMQRIRTLSPWRDRDLETQELIDYAPRILNLIDVRLHYDSHQAFFDAHPEALQRAADHARMRMTQDIGVVPATSEYVMLREEVWRELRRAEQPTASLAEFLDVEQAINGTLDAVIIATMTAYLREATGA
ncbi:MAG: response regulator [Dehalococcoidia bacterium]